MQKTKEPLTGKQFAAELKRHQTRLGLNQVELAALFGIHANTVGMWLRGDYAPLPITMSGALALLEGMK